MSKQQVLEQALSLSFDERADLAHELLLSLETLTSPRSGVETTPEESARRWGEVAAKRAENIRSGKTKAIPTGEVLRDVKSRMG